MRVVVAVIVLKRVVLKAEKDMRAHLARSHTHTHTHTHKSALVYGIFIYGEWVFRCWPEVKVDLSRVFHHNVILAWCWLVLGAAAMAGWLALCLSGHVIWPVAVVVGKFYMNTRDFQPTTDMYC